MPRSIAVALLALLAVLTPTSPAQALTDTPGQILLLGDSLSWQTCSGPAQVFPPGAPRVLRDHDGGCHGWSGATTADMIYEVRGGRFHSNGDGQPHPRFHGRGQKDP